MKLYLAALGQDEFVKASHQMVHRFAELLQPTRDLTSEEAVAEATAQFTTMLPRGLGTPCQHFRQIMLAPQSTVMPIPQAIGFAWVHINPSNQYGVLCWFEIYPAWRGQKLSRPAFTTMETWLREEMKVPILNLEVFTHNTPAIALYEHCGFKKIGYVMQRKLHS